MVDTAAAVVVADFAVVAEADTPFTAAEAAGSEARHQPSAAAVVAVASGPPLQCFAVVDFSADRRFTAADIAMAARCWRGAISRHRPITAIAGITFGHAITATRSPIIMVRAIIIHGVTAGS